MFILQDMFLNCNQLFIKVENRQFFINGYDKDYMNILKMTLGINEGLDLISKSVHKFLEADFICVFSILSNVIEMKKMNGSYLSIKDEDGILKGLFEDIKEKYFNDRIFYFMKKALNLKTVHLLCSPDDPFSSYDCSQDETKISFSLHLKEGQIIEVDKVFLNLLLDFLFDYKGSPIVMYEYFYFQNQQAISLKNYLLKKGKIKVYFNDALYDFMVKWISIYEEVSSRKVIKVLNGYRSDEKAKDKTLIRERLRIIKGGIL